MLQDICKSDRIKFIEATLSSIVDRVIADCQGTVLYINASESKMTGWSKKEIAGKPFCSI